MDNSDSNAASAQPVDYKAEAGKYGLEYSDKPFSAAPVDYKTEAAKYGLEYSDKPFSPAPVDYKAEAAKYGLEYSDKPFSPPPIDEGPIVPTAPGAQMAADAYSKIPHELRGYTPEELSRPGNFINPRTGKQATVGDTLTQVPVLDDPTQGVQQIGQGVAQMAQPDAAEKLRGLGHIGLGGLQVAAPAMAATAVVNPLQAAKYLAIGKGMQMGGQAGAQALGANPEDAAEIGNVAGALPLVYGTAKLGLRGLADQRAAVKAHIENYFETQARGRELGQNIVGDEGLDLPNGWKVSAIGATNQGRPIYQVSGQDGGKIYTDDGAGVQNFLRSNGILPKGPELPPEPAAQVEQAPDVERQQSPEPVKPTQASVITPATPNPPTAALPTVPEDPATIEAQMQQLVGGQRKVVMFPKGTPLLTDFPAGVRQTSDGFGNIYVYRPDLGVKPSDLKKAAKQNKLPEILGSTQSGLGAPDKADLQGEPAAVTVHAPDGTEVQSAATDEANAPTTIAAAHEVVPPGGHVSIGPIEDVVQARQPEALQPEVVAREEDPEDYVRGLVVPEAKEFIHGMDHVSPYDIAGHFWVSPATAEEVLSHLESHGFVGPRGNKGLRRVLRSTPPQEFPDWFEHEHADPNLAALPTPTDEAPQTLPVPPPITAEPNAAPQRSQSTSSQKAAASSQKAAASSQKAAASSRGLPSRELPSSDLNSKINSKDVLYHTSSNPEQILTDGEIKTKYQLNPANYQGATTPYRKGQPQGVSTSRTTRISTGGDFATFVIDPSKAPPMQPVERLNKAKAMGRIGTPKQHSEFQAGPNAPTLSETENQTVGLKDAIPISAVREIQIPAERKDLSTERLAEIRRLAAQRNIPVVVDTKANLIKRRALGFPQKGGVSEEQNPEQKPEAAEQVASGEHKHQYASTQVDLPDDISKALIAHGEGAEANPPEVSEQAETLAKFIKSHSPTAISKAFNRYAEESNAQTLFGSPSQAEIFDREFKPEPATVTLGSGLGALQPAMEVVGKAAKDYFQKVTVPRVQKIVDGLQHGVVDLAHLLAPKWGVESHILDEIYGMTGGREAAEFILASQLDKWAQRVEGKVVRNGLKFKRVGGMSQAEMIDFIDRQKTGKKQKDAELQALSDFLKRADAELYAVLKKINPDAAWLDNHYRVLWDTIPGSTAKGTRGIFGRKPLAGSGGFLRQHVLDNMSDGIALGGIPVTYNPLEMFQLAYRDAMHYITAHRMWDNLQSIGARVWVKHGGRGPEGFSKFDDPLANKWFKTSQGMVHAGDWWVEDGAARLLKNYISRDLVREHPVGRGLLFIKMASTSAELSFSTFHGVFESFVAIGSQMQRAVARGWNVGVAQWKPDAMLEAAKELATSPLAPITHAKFGAEAKDMFANYDTLSKTPEGQAWLKQYPDAMDGMRMLFHSGLKVKMPRDFYVTQTKKFIEHWNSANKNDPYHYIAAAVHAIPAFSQAIMMPLFDRFIPNLKTGFFLRDYALAKQEYASRLFSGEMTPEEIGRQVGENVENRFGELNFDNLHLNRTFKTVLQLAFRSVTWLLGNIRIGGKAVPGQLREIGRAFKEKRVPLIDRNVATLVGIAMITAIMGTIIHRVFTGEWPKTLKDVTHPMVDKATGMRLSLATYWRVYEGMIHAPVHAIASSVAGFWTKLYEVMENRDLYNNARITESDDSFPMKVVENLAHLVSLPFSATNFYQARKESGNTAAKISTFLGFPKAPAWIDQTKAERLAAEFHQQNGTDSQSRAESEHRRAENAIRVAIRRGDDPKALIAQFEKSGDIAPKDVKGIVKSAKEPPLLRSVKGLGDRNLTQVLQVYDVATPDERKEIGNYVNMLAGRARSQPWKWTPEAEKISRRYFGIYPYRSASGIPDPGKPGQNPIQ